MIKLEFWETAFSHIFDLSSISDIILDKEKKVFQVIIGESPILEMFLKKKIKYNSIIFYAQGWDRVTITSCDKKTNKIKEIDTIEITKLLVFNGRKRNKTIFWGPSVVTGNTIRITFKNLQSYNFFEKE